MQRSSSYSPQSKQQQQQQQQHEEDVISERKLRTVSYQTENHYQVLTQLHGSVWPRVMPYCLANLVLSIAIYYLRQNQIIDLSFSDRGHTFMSLMVSFLIVTRSNIAYSRFMEARDGLTLAMKSCRELTQYMITFTRYDAVHISNNNSSVVVPTSPLATSTSPPTTATATATANRAQLWRFDIARRTIILLRTVITVLEYNTVGQHAWKLPELTRDEKHVLLHFIGKSNERSPIILAVFLRSAIASHFEYLAKPLHVNMELKLYGIVADFITAYHNLMKLVTTPFPFPLVQMTRTCLFLWVFTIPLAMITDMEDQLIPLLLVVFFITYGFIGLEFVSIELDDPFGDDPNDFDVVGLAKVVFEDIYLAIHDIDGKEAASKLRQCIENPSAPHQQKQQHDEMERSSNGGTHFSGDFRSCYSNSSNGSSKQCYLQDGTSPTKPPLATTASSLSRSSMRTASVTNVTPANPILRSSGSTINKTSGNGGDQCGDDALRESRRHKRFDSIDTWRNAQPAPTTQVGTDRSKLLLSSKGAGSYRSLDVFGGLKLNSGDGIDGNSPPPPVTFQKRSSLLLKANHSLSGMMRNSSTGGDGGSNSPTDCNQKGKNGCCPGTFPDRRLNMSPDARQQLYMTPTNSTFDETCADTFFSNTSVDNDSHESLLRRRSPNSDTEVEYESDSSSSSFQHLIDSSQQRGDARV